MTSPIDAPLALSYRVLIGPLNRLVSEIFSIKVADTQTKSQSHTDTSIDVKGRLELAAARANNRGR